MQYARATRIGLYKIVYSFIFISDDNSVEEDKLKKSEKVGVHELDSVSKHEICLGKSGTFAKGKGQDLKIIQFLELKFPFHYID